MKKMIFLFAVLTAAVFNANAQVQTGAEAQGLIVQGTVGNGSYVDCGGQTVAAYGLDFNNDGTLEFKLDSGYISSYAATYANAKVSYCWEDANSSNIVANASTPNQFSFLNVGDTVNAASGFNGQGEATLHTIFGDDKYFGFCIAYPDGMHYGYAKVNFYEMSVEYKIYYNTKAGAGIRVGDTFTPCTVTLDDDGNGFVEGEGTYAYGDSVTVIAVPYEGYTFKEWKTNDAAAFEGIDRTQDTMTFVITKDVALTATFEVARFTPIDTVDLAADNCDFHVDSLYGLDETDIEGFCADSTKSANLTLKSARLASMTYPDTILDYGEVAIYDGEDGNEYYNILYIDGDVVVTVSTIEGVLTYNVKCSAVCEDSVLYNLDLTYHIPYEKSSYETVTGNATVEHSNDMVYYAFSDKNYTYSVSVEETADSNHMELGGSTQLRVYELGGDGDSGVLFEGYSGFVDRTMIDDTTASIVGEIICKGDVKFYINCKKPEAVENVNSSLNTQNSKFLKDGQLYIRRGDVIYDAKGTRVE